MCLSSGWPWGRGGVGAQTLQDCLYFALLTATFLLKLTNYSGRRSRPLEVKSSSFGGVRGNI